MELHVKDDAQIVEVWLTRREQDDPVVQDYLKPFYQTCKERKYHVSVFLSGNEPLYPLTSHLLCHTRKRMAQSAVSREKQQDCVRTS